MLHIDKTRSIISHIFKHSLLRSLLIVSLIIPIFIPLRSYLLVLPKFSDKLLTFSEEEALKTANHISRDMVTVKQNKIVIDQALRNMLYKVMGQFNLEKIKLFSENGLILFSTDEKEINTVNKHDYFHQLVAKGEIYSKIVQKNQTTLEGRIVNRDVAEIYVPIMFDNLFVGAFELYYDLTDHKKALDTLAHREILVSLFISLFMSGIILIMVFLTSRSIFEEKTAKNRLKDINQDLEQLVADKTHELQVNQEVAIESLAILAEFHDLDTGEHLVRIREYTKVIANALLDNSPYSVYLNKKGRESYVRDIVMASTLHDVGKTAISKEILCKPGKLSKEEFEEIKKHTVVAWDALNKGNQIFVECFHKDSYLALAGNIALYHHEKWDGSGYPTGLKGEAIPLSARIVALVDVYDALRSKRPYKEPWSHNKTVALIRSEAGKHFDPVIVEYFFLNHEKFHEISKESRQDDVAGAVEGEQYAEQV